MIQSKILKHYNESKISSFNYEPFEDIDVSTEDIIYPDFTEELKESKNKLKKYGASKKSSDFLGYSQSSDSTEKSFTDLKEEHFEEKNSANETVDFSDKSTIKQNEGESSTNLDEFDHIAERLNIETEEKTFDKKTYSNTLKGVPHKIKGHPTKSEILWGEKDFVGENSEKKDEINKLGETLNHDVEIQPHKNKEQPKGVEPSKITDSAIKTEEDKTKEEMDTTTKLDEEQEEDKTIEEMDTTTKFDEEQEENKTTEEMDLTTKPEEKSKEDEKTPTEQKKEVIELKRHLEILEAERNKYRKLGYKEGYEKGLEEAKDKFLKEYEAKKEDYLELLASSFAEALAEIKKVRDILLDIDKEIPKIVINFVRRIIGFERKINDRIIISVVRAKLDKLKALEDIKFYVHPDDFDYIEAEFPGYNVSKDPTVLKGSFKVITKIGEVDFDINKMLDNLEELINEELKVAETT